MIIYVEDTEGNRYPFTRQYCIPSEFLRSIQEENVIVPIPFDDTAVSFLIRYMDSISIGMIPSTIPKPLKQTLSVTTKGWERTYLDLISKESGTTICNIYLGSTYLHIHSLTDLLSGWISTILTNRYTIDTFNTLFSTVTYQREEM